MYKLTFASLIWFFTVSSALGLFPDMLLPLYLRAVLSNSEPDFRGKKQCFVVVNCLKQNLLNERKGQDC